MSSWRTYETLLTSLIWKGACFKRLCFSTRRIDRLRGRTSVYRFRTVQRETGMRFSERHGYKGHEPDIAIREDAPENLRFAVAQIAVDCGMSPESIRDVVCRILYVAPDRNNWSQYPNIWNEVTDILRGCEWFKVYDVAEALYNRLQRRSHEVERYRSELNRFFRENGIGWELTDDGITFRGGDTFAAATAEAGQALGSSGRAKAASEIHEAIRDISRRPRPDRTGAIQHAMAALECTARDVLGEPNATLGTLLPRLGLPKPLDVAVDKLWGFACERARHVREGDDLDDTQAELVVSVCCAVCAFLVKRLPPERSQ
jgi:AbiJ N-terminal domain 4